MVQIMRDMWGNWSGARLAPRRFAILYGVTWLFLAILLSLGLLMALTLFAGDDKPNAIAGRLAGLLGVGLLLWFAALINITVKRGRDIGVPGFVTGILFLVMMVLGGMPIFAAILLALVPSDTVAAAGKA
jgi:uncharacterized membrane protein YhaH (DUF805 family)